MEKNNKSRQIFNCDYCDYKCSRKYDWMEHIATRKHISRTALDEKKPAETVQLYVCESCDFSCSHKSSWSAHISTRKHKTRTNLETNNTEPLFFCKQCNIQCNARSSLWYHEQKCIIIENKDEPLENTFTENASTVLDTHVVLELIKQNQDFKQLLLEQSAKIVELSTQPTTINNTNNNTNNNNTQNNHFNLHFFLNES